MAFVLLRHVGTSTKSSGIPLLDGILHDSALRFSAIIPKVARMSIILADFAERLRVLCLEITAYHSTMNCLASFLCTKILSKEQSIFQQKSQMNLNTRQITY